MSGIAEQQAADALAQQRIEAARQAAQAAEAARKAVRAAKGDRHGHQ